MLTCSQWQRNRYTIGGAGVRGFEAADYPCEASACDGQKLEAGGLAPRFRRPCMQLFIQLDQLLWLHKDKFHIQPVSYVAYRGILAVYERSSW